MGFESSPTVIFSLFRVLSGGLINKCYWNIAKKIIVSHTVRMFKQMFWHTALLTRMLSIIIFIVIPSIYKVVSCFPNILLFTTPKGQKINQAVIVTSEFAIYFTCLASKIASKCVSFRDILTYFTPFMYRHTDIYTCENKRRMMYLSFIKTSLLYTWVWNNNFIINNFK